MQLQLKQFKMIELADPFFDSLKAGYAEFPIWFQRKAEDWAYVFYGDLGTVEGFLYLKIESDAVEDTAPPLPPARRVKVGTFKVNPHGTRLGERFVKKLFDHALHVDAAEIYVTAFPEHTALLALFARYGFEHRANKTSPNGTELVLVRTLQAPYQDVTTSYPLIPFGRNSAYLLALYPQWHTRLLPDSILRSEDDNIVQDISHANSIHKVYLAAMPGMEALRRGDLLLIYRTSDGQGSAYYRSVATSICVVEEYRTIHSFSSLNEFMGYCRPYSVFTDDELAQFWARKNYPHVVRFTYNVALSRRPNRKVLIENVGLNADARWGFMPLTHSQLLSIAQLGNVHESLIIHQA
ncbi:N-acetyltransferase [Xanthomonas axonopodis]